MDIVTKYSIGDLVWGVYRTSITERNYKGPIEFYEFWVSQGTINKITVEVSQLKESKLFQQHTTYKVGLNNDFLHVSDTREEAFAKLDQLLIKYPGSRISKEWGVPRVPEPVINKRQDAKTNI